MALQCILLHIHSRGIWTNVLMFWLLIVFYCFLKIIWSSSKLIPLCQKTFFSEELKFTDPLIIFVGEGTERSLVQCREDYSERKGDGTKVKFSTFLKLDAWTVCIIIIIIMQFYLQGPWAAFCEQTCWNGLREVHGKVFFLPALFIPVKIKCLQPSERLL